MRGACPPGGGSRAPLGAATVRHLAAVGATMGDLYADEPCQKEGLSTPRFVTQEARAVIRFVTKIGCGTA